MTFGHINTTVFLRTTKTHSRLVVWMYVGQGHLVEIYIMVKYGKYVY